MAGPIRMCRVCRQRLTKSQLQRWVQSEGWRQDDAQTLPGRGVYTCSPACAAKLPKPRQLTAK